MTPNNSLQAIILAKSFRDIWPELHAHAPLTRSPTRLWLRIGPEHLHHETGLAWLALIVTIKLPYVV